MLAEDDRTTLQQATVASAVAGLVVEESALDSLEQEQQQLEQDKEETVTLPLHERIEEESIDDNDDETRSSSASGKIPNLLPLNLLQVESEFFQDHDGYYARGASQLKQLSSLLLLDSDDFLDSDDTDDEVDSDTNEEDSKKDVTEKKGSIPDDSDDDDNEYTATATYSNTTPITSQTELEMEAIEMEASEEYSNKEAAETDTPPATLEEDQDMHTTTTTTTTIHRKDHGTDEKEVQQDITTTEQQQLDKKEPQLDTEEVQDDVNKAQDGESNPQTEPDDSSDSSPDTGDSIEDSTTDTAKTNSSDKDGEEHSSSEKSVDAAEGKEDSVKQQQQQVEKDKEELQVDKQAIEDEEDEDFSISDRVAVDYASKSAGALVLEKSPKFQGTSNLLNGDRDRYAIAPCGEKKFVVLSLSEDIYVKQVKLANYELYSSRVKDIQIQISQTMGNWVDLGIYTATPDSGVQAVDLREPAWGRYLKFKFLSHYGEEFYCTLSQIMVHGSTMVQGFHEHLQETSDEEEEEEEAETDDDATTSSSADTTTTTANAGAETTGTHSAVSATATTKDAAAAAAAEAASEHMDGITPDMAADELDHVPEEVQQDVGVEASTEKKEVVPQEAKKDAAPVNAADADEDAASSSPAKESKAAGDSVASEGESSSEDGTGLDDLEDENDSTSENNDSDFISRAVHMSSRKDRNTSTALPAASIGLSSTNVFSTIAGRLEPLHLKGMDKLSKMRNPFPNSGHLNGMLSKATDSTKAIRNALTDAAILENFQHWGGDTHRMQGEKSSDKEMFGITSIGPREQSLVEKLTAYIQRHDINQIKRISSGDGNPAESDAPASEESKSEGAAADADSKHSDREAETTESQDSEKHTADDRKIEGAESFEGLHDTDLALAALLENLPSIECLKTLDFAAFKAKAMASKKGGHGHSGHAAAGHAAEPIFKMLTDQIKTLQANLAVHDQFSKDAFLCYQRVLLDVVVELQSMRLNHETRLLQLEQDIQETKTVRWVFVIYQLIMGLPNWVSLSIATFITSYISPSVIFKPLALVESLVDSHFSRHEHVVLSWTLTVCIVTLLAVATIGLCQRILSAAKGSEGPRTISPSGSSRETTVPQETTEREKCQSSIAKGPEPKCEVDEVTNAPDVDPKDTICVDCNLVAAEVEVDPCVETPSVLQETPSVANAATSSPNRLVDEASSFEPIPSATPRYNATESGMRTPDPTGAGDDDCTPSLQEARKSPPSPSSVATLPSCEKEHKVDEQEVGAEPEMKRSISVTFTISDDLGLKSDFTADSNLRQSLSANN